MKNQSSGAASNTVDSLFEQYYEENLHFYPMEATSTGDNRFNDQLPNDLSDKFGKDFNDFCEKYLKKLNDLDLKAPSQEQLISVDLLKRNLQLGIEKHKFHEEYTPINQFWSLTLTMPQLGSGASIQPFKTEKDYLDFLKRIDGFTIWCDTAIAKMRLGIKAGIVNPKSIMVKVLPQLQSSIVTDYKTSLFYKPVNQMPESFPTSVKDSLSKLYASAIERKIMPSYKKLYKFMKEEYIPSCRASSGLYGTPQGKEYYQYLIRYYTGTNLLPDTIYNIGLEQVSRIKQEMQQVMTETGFKGNLKEFFEYTANDKKFKPYKTADEVLVAYRAILARIEPKVSEQFTKKPRTAFEIRETEKFREATASAEYSPGSADGKRPGVFYVPVPNPANFNENNMESTFLHEAIPGHHFQISLAQEMDSMPRFRKYGWNGAYGEGWALYTESLGKDLGIYTNPYQYFGRLSNEMHRAIRLVVDIGLHAKGWTREQVIQYMLDNESIGKEEAIAETERYMAIPGQALSYKIGELSIRACRTKAEKELGNKFKIAEFHEQILGSGCLPIDVLEKKIDGWIERVKEK